VYTCHIYCKYSVQGVETQFEMRNLKEGGKGGASGSRALSDDIQDGPADE
jgi:hypothetical protein